MANIQCKTKAKTNPSQKPRVYFTCHPDDFALHFKKICDDIFKTHDCAIFYTEDMREDIPDQDKATDLGSNNLFVIPVTFKLLTEPNRAMDSDIPYAIQENIPLLPFVMEPRLDSLYSCADKFGERQYLSLYSIDNTEIPYEEKLKKFLDSVLISSEMAMRIRDAFDAYVFLSYRKKDRRYANELMRKIHRRPDCQNIAIWYDEFLTPGESFVENIHRIMRDSRWFALLVTPSILEEPDGKPNFVMGEEYPAAKKSGMGILPVEMEKTDNETLHRKFEGLPECVNPYNDKDFNERFLDIIAKTEHSSSDTGKRRTERLFLRGIAYMEGVDVEVDRKRGLEMITAAAQEELPEAMRKLLWMYMRGQGVKLDYQEASKWAERAADYYLEERSGGSAETISALLDLVIAYNSLGNHQQALAVGKKAMALAVEQYGKSSPMIFAPFRYLTETYFHMGNYRKATEYLELLYVEYSNFWGAEDLRTIGILSKLARAYDRKGDYTKAIGLQLHAYLLFCKILGEEDSAALNSLSELAVAYDKKGQYKHAIECQKKAYSSKCVVLGEKHPDTLVSLNNLTVSYCKLGDKQLAIPLLEKNYKLHCEVLGTQNPVTIGALSNMANFYGQTGEHQKALGLKQLVYNQFAKTLGAEHPTTLNAVINLAIEYSELGNQENANDLIRTTYPLYIQILGAEHPDTLYVKKIASIVQQRLLAAQAQKNSEKEKMHLMCQELRRQIEAYKSVDNISKALAISQELYECQCKISGEKDLDSIHVLQAQVELYCEIGEYQEALKVAEKAYADCVELVGEDGAETIACANKIVHLYLKLGDRKMSAEFKKKALANRGISAPLLKLFKGKR